MLEVLGIIILAPVALAAGFGLIRLFSSRDFWIFMAWVLGILAVGFNLLVASYS